MGPEWFETGSHKSNLINAVLLIEAESLPVRRQPFRSPHRPVGRRRVSVIPSNSHGRASVELVCAGSIGGDTCRTPPMMDMDIRDALYDGGDVL